ncbi:hypothetical protein BU25DRAFT_437239 [Macroventuria anomochaeta]|uniref:Uncharacterized protein n=1 Tax=Macroventuria anomochaeta TaxID=301207 RepID=A0ACB6SDQ7_9PLEO|nr:uncharacterized protein BU25DRAFT_437239 [Macroventuria anomochaeta]KAF2631454.1 hypothetical protein BU25DRAFT_437239 [Macroventuria anomochaeta]
MAIFSAGLSNVLSWIHLRVASGRRRRFCLHWLTAYRVLISSVIMINLGVWVSQMVVNTAVETPLTATAANIMAAVLLRQEEVINFSFKLVSHLPPTLPLSLRKAIGDFHHYGGLHIGCALSALLWYIMFTGLNTVRVLNFLQLGNMTTSLYIDIVLAYTALLAILIVCLTAIPRFRVRFHNTFEATHRFGGWAALLVLWVHAGITTLTPDAVTPLYAHPSTWMLAITALLIILPWLRIRRVPITAHPISAREVQLTFPYTSMPYTSTIRTSVAPLTEWHAFATIPVTDTTAKIIISRAGDWTASIISCPPTQLWVRHPPTLNFLTFAPLFNSLLLIATGAGIGPMLSLLASPAVTHMRAQGRKVKVMWCAYDPYAPHWAFVLDAVWEVDKEARVWDSKVGRPDVASEARYLAMSEGIETVMVVSNPKVTKDVVDECKIAGLAAYGAVYDS